MQGDDRIDEKENQIEEEVLKILSLHQPVTADLRTRLLSFHPRNLESFAGLPSHDRRGSQNGQNSLDALVNQDTQLARDVLTMDNEIDSINRDMFVTLQEVMRQDSNTIEQAVHLLSASRHLEHIADLATNIAENVVFMVEGELIRHHFEDYGRGDSGSI